MEILNSHFLKNLRFKENDKFTQSLHHAILKALNMILQIYVINNKWNQMKFIEKKSVRTYLIKTKQINIEQGLFPKKTKTDHYILLLYLHEIMLVNVKLREDYFARLV